MGDKILVFIPTYNENENVKKIVEEIVDLNISGLDILFIDDNSIDGTGVTLDYISKKNKSIKVIHRDKKLGVGSAHKDGIAYAYDKGYTKLVTMDADFTHSPSIIKCLLENIKYCDVVVTSRYIEKNSLNDWNVFRKSLTWVGHFLTTFLLNLPYDASGAFRLYDLIKVDRKLFGKVLSNGYSFFFESLFIINFNKYLISEIPIKLPARTYGESKMRWTDIFKSLEFLMRIFFNKIFNPNLFLLTNNPNRNIKRG